MPPSINHTTACLPPKAMVGGINPHSHIDERRDDTETQDSFSGGVLRLNRSDVCLGRVLGTGSFCVVRAVESIRLPYSFPTSMLDGAISDPDHHLAVKYLKNGKKLSSAQKQQGRLDLANEVEILLSLTNHPNIVDIRAINAAKVNDNFFVMDRLSNTLDNKIQQDWRGKSVLALSNGIIPGISTFSMEQSCDSDEALLAERLLAAFQIVSALEYLHGKR